MARVSKPKQAGWKGPHQSYGRSEATEAHRGPQGPTEADRGPHKINVEKEEREMELVEIYRVVVLRSLHLKYLL